MKQITKFILLLVSLLALTGCYFGNVESSQVGVETNRGLVTDIKGPGGHQSIRPTI